jgi:hypothetical protein
MSSPGHGLGMNSTQQNQLMLRNLQALSVLSTIWRFGELKPRENTDFAWLLVQHKIFTVYKLPARNWPCDAIAFSVINNLKQLNTYASTVSLLKKYGCSSSGHKVAPAEHLWLLKKYGCSSSQDTYGCSRNMVARATISVRATIRGSS